MLISTIAGQWSQLFWS